MIVSTKVNRGAVLVRQAAGARKIHLAASGERNGFADGGAALDVVGRDRLASSGAQLRAADGGVNEDRFPLRNFLC